VGYFVVSPLLVVSGLFLLCLVAFLDLSAGALVAAPEAEEPAEPPLSIVPLEPGLPFALPLLSVPEPPAPVSWDVPPVPLLPVPRSVLPELPG